jgi:hypothetical protein
LAGARKPVQDDDERGVVCIRRQTVRGCRCLAVLCVLQSIAAMAADGIELSMKSHAMASTVVPAEVAPTKGGTTPLTDPLLGAGAQGDARPIPHTCRGSLRDLCYDGVEGRLVYRGAAPYMPRFEGFTPESVSLRHNGLAVRYSFR